MEQDRQEVEELYTAARNMVRMKLSEFKAFKPETTAEAMAHGLGRRALMGDAKSFEELLKLAAFAQEQEDLDGNPDPLSLALTNLAEQLENVQQCKA